MGYKDLEQKREYQRQWMAKRRLEFFSDKFCVQCGSTENLELDHIDPSTKISHKIFSWSKERQLEEIAKCQILCYECHRKKSNDQISKISKEQRQEILELSERFSQRELARKYNISPSHVRRIQGRIAWNRHI